jgi:SH3-like domain-containing protein
MGAASRNAKAAALAAALALAATANAADYRSVGTAGAVLYDGPSAKARRLWVAPRGMPIELLAAPDPAWIKARDVGGDVFWLARADVSEAPALVAATAAAVRQSPSESAPVEFRVERGVLLEPLDPTPAAGWFRVRHRDGGAGWVRAAEVWGR